MPIPTRLILLPTDGAAQLVTLDDVAQVSAAKLPGGARGQRRPPSSSPCLSPESFMLARRPSHYPAATLAIFAALALLLLFTGCGPVEGPYLHTGLDSADTGEPGDLYADVADLPACEGVWVRLPPTSDDVDRDHDYYPLSEVHALVYGDPDWSGPPAMLYPVVYRTFAQDDHVVGWTVGGDAVLSDRLWVVVYQPFPDWSADTQPFALACG